VIQTKARNEKAKAVRDAARTEFERERAEIFGKPEASATAQPSQPVAAEQKPAQQPPQQQHKHQQNRR
jgi:hypothetical protein